MLIKDKCFEINERCIYEHIITGNNTSFDKKGMMESLKEFESIFGRYKNNSYYPMLKVEIEKRIKDKELTS